MKFYGTACHMIRIKERTCISASELEDCHRQPMNRGPYFDDHSSPPHLPTQSVVHRTAT